MIFLMQPHPSFQNITPLHLNGVEGDTMFETPHLKFEREDGLEREVMFKMSGHGALVTRVAQDKVSKQ